MTEPKLSARSRRRLSAKRKRELEIDRKISRFRSLPCATPISAATLLGLKNKETSKETPPLPVRTRSIKYQRTITLNTLPETTYHFAAGAGVVLSHNGSAGQSVKGGVLVTPLTSGGSVYVPVVEKSMNPAYAEIEKYVAQVTSDSGIKFFARLLATWYNLSAMHVSVHCTHTYDI